MAMLTLADIHPSLDVHDNSYAKGVGIIKRYGIYGTLRVF